jgi:hypothetical protein
LISGEITAGFDAKNVIITPGEEDIWINVHPFDLTIRESFPEINFEI